MKQNKYKFKKWVLVPIFLLLCSLIVGLGYSKPANALAVGINDNSGTGSIEWYNLTPYEIITEIVDSGTVIAFPIDSFFPTDETITSSISPINIDYRFNIGALTNVSIVSNVFLDVDNVTLNNYEYSYYDHLVTLEGGGNYGNAQPLSIEFKYKDIVFPYGYTGSELNQWGNARPIRTESQLEMINSNFFSNMAVYLYKPIGVSEYNVHFNNVYLKYAVMKPESWNGGVNDSVNCISNLISYNTYNWTYSNDNNYYLNPYDNTLYPILTETEQYYKIDLYNLLRMVIDTEHETNFANEENVGKYLVYFPYISVNGFSDILNLTSNRVLAVNGSCIHNISKIYDNSDFYNDENVPFSSLYIDSLDYMSFYNYVIPNVVIPKPTDMTSWLVTSVGAFVNAEIFPGFAIGGILAVLIALPLAIWLIKIILGG